MNQINVTTESERMQLIRALIQRRDFLDSINPVLWDDTDREGKLDDCRAATVRLLQQAKRVKLSSGNEAQ